MKRPGSIYSKCAVCKFIFSAVVTSEESQEQQQEQQHDHKDKYSYPRLVFRLAFIRLCHFSPKMVRIGIIGAFISYHACFFEDRE